MAIHLSGFWLTVVLASRGHLGKTGAINNLTGGVLVDFVLIQVIIQLPLRLTMCTLEEINILYRKDFFLHCVSG